MILTRWTEARRHFAASGALANDGLPVWPGPVLPNGAIDNTGATGLERANGFTGPLVASTAGGQVFSIPSGTGSLVDATKFNSGDPIFPINIICGLFPDAVPGTHDYAWYISQRRDSGQYPVIGFTTPVEFPIASQVFAVSMPNPLASCHIQLSLNLGAVALILPGLSGGGLLTPDAFQLLCKNVIVYCTRYSDHAFMWSKLYTRGVA